MFDARVGTNAAFMVVSGGTASAIVRSRAAAKVVKIVGKAEAPPGKAVPVGEARIPQSPQAVKGTTVTLAQEQRLMNPDELKVMLDTDCIISMAGMQPIYAEKILYYKDPALKGRANLPLPHVPELKVNLAAKPPAATLKPEYVPPEVLEDFNWRDAANAEELARSVLEAILPAGSPPEFVAQMVPAIARNWGEGSLSVIASILKETSGITVDTKEMHKEAA